MRSAADARRPLARTDQPHLRSGQPPEVRLKSPGGKRSVRDQGLPAPPSSDHGLRDLRFGEHGLLDPASGEHGCVI